MRTGVFGLLRRDEADELARDCQFRQRTPQQIPPLEFALCCALASVVEAKRGFASVWRLLAAAAGIHVVRSAVTQRFGPGSAALMQGLFERAVQRVPSASHPQLLAKLQMFKQVLADDASVLKLSPLLKKLFPATRTNSVDAAAKLHASADIVHRRIVSVKVTGERTGDLDAARELGIEPDTLYIRDLGYTDYNEFARVVVGGADLLMRLKSNANPQLLHVRHGVIAPRRSEGKKLSELTLTRCHDTFDLDARFHTPEGGYIDLRVVGRYNSETGKYHRYVTSLPPEQFSIKELETLYCLRWVIELMFKLLRSSCHLDHLDTKDPDALRTHIYSSLLAATILSAVVFTAAKAAGIAPDDISLLTVGIAAPLLVLPLLFLWCEREITYDELAASIIRTVAFGCREQNPRRKAEKWGPLR